MGSISLIGCGFVADLYMRSLQVFPDVTVFGVYDRDTARLRAFCDHYNLNAFDSLEALLKAHPKDGLILNLTNPGAHYEINKACLDAGHHVYSEKPLAMQMDQAKALYDLAMSKGLMLGSAPCSMLGEAAQTLGWALRNDICGTPRLIYAELDEGFITQAAYTKWISDTGAPWPFEDEFNVGCTLEHAGYFLSWLIAWFGPVRTVVSASAEVLPDKIGKGSMAPDFSVATLFFENGPPVRMTNSIVAPHDHSLRVFGDKGVLQVDEAWDNSAKVRFSKRIRVRRRLMESPIKKRIALKQPTHPKVERWGAAALNFMLGPVEMLTALAQGKATRITPEFSLHMTEVTLAVQNAGEFGGAQKMTTRCDPLEPMPWAR